METNMHAVAELSTKVTTSDIIASVLGGAWFIFTTSGLLYLLSENGELSAHLKNSIDNYKELKTTRNLHRAAQSCEELQTIVESFSLRN